MLCRQGRRTPDCNPVIGGASAAEPHCAPASGCRSPQSTRSRPGMMLHTSVASPPCCPSHHRDTNARLKQTHHSTYRPKSAGRPAPRRCPPELLDCSGLRFCDCANAPPVAMFGLRLRRHLLRVPLVAPQQSPVTSESMQPLSQLSDCAAVAVFFAYNI